MDFRNQRLAVTTGLTLAAAAVVAGCSTSSPAPPPAPPPTPVDTVAEPPPDQRGPLLTVEGTVRWRTDHVGCADMVTSAGQTLRITGQIATDRERAVFGGAPPSEQVRITGYAVTLLNGATVCGTGIRFVAEKVEPVH